MKKRRIVTTAMAGLMCVTAVGSLASCTEGAIGGAIKVAYAETGYGKVFMEKWAEEFEKESGTKVILEGSPTMTGEVETRLQTNSNLPDVFIVLDMGWQKVAASQKLEPLDDVYAATAYTDANGDKVTIEEFMNESMRDYGKLLDGHYYAIPWTDGPTGIIYNKTMFEQNGWNQSPETVEELMELCDTINAANVPTGNPLQPYVKPFTLYSAYGGYIVDTWWAQYEGVTNYRKFYSYVTDDFDPEDPDYENCLTTTGYLQQGRVEALRAFEYLFFDRDNWTKKNMTFGVSDHTTAHGDFGSGRAAMIVEGAWMQNEAKPSLLKEDGTNKFEYAMMPTPFLDAAASVGGSASIMASQAGDFMCIPKRANNVAGAKEFLKFINSKTGCEIFTKATGGAVRPFQYDARTIDGVNASAFMQSCWDVYYGSDIVYSYSTNPMQWSNKVGKWPGIGAPYEFILNGDYLLDSEGNDIWDDEKDDYVDQAVTICKKCYQYVDNNWWDIWDSVQ